MESESWHWNTVECKKIPQDLLVVIDPQAIMAGFIFDFI